MKKGFDTTKECASHERCDFDYVDGKSITCWYQSLPGIIEFHVKQLRIKVFMNNDVSRTEVSLGVDHRKNYHIFLALVLIRHTDNRELHRLEIKIGEK